MDSVVEMSAEVFHPSSSCPLCHNPATSAIGRFNGRLVCPCCHSRLVLSGSGQFVRDPFTQKQLISIQKLRRQSRPLARLLRDVQPSRRTLFGGAAILAVAGLTWINLSGQVPTWRDNGATAIEQSEPQ
ncbi:MAG: hypothetical protein HC805_02575 [Alkalinema sp. RL_2_19]|nr:hypothetical protein [Alkalinema sp. RL_2_19]